MNLIRIFSLYTLKSQGYFASKSPSGHSEGQKLLQVHIQELSSKAFQKCGGVNGSKLPKLRTDELKVIWKSKTLFKKTFTFSVSIGIVS